MRDDIDKVIAEALSAEDRALLERYGEDRGFFAQLTAAFRGPMAGVVWLVYIAQAIMFFVGVYLAWHFFRETDVLVALRFGLSAVVMFTMAVVMKTAMGTVGESNRVIREVKRLELQVAMLKARLDG